jgi:hypothetical protein
VTVISGNIGSSHGETFEKKGELLKPGAQGILQVQFVGPGGIDYINPADDPRKK